ncbi:MAG: helix-turn-helix transcriptional regulator [Clostridiales bacterium]|nr:helix-turn-helix transcriptional regulator [Clostridiales bacterium]
MGARIRELRRKRGWSQEKLGDMVGFSQSKISKIENGNWDSLSDLRLIARALGVKLKKLIDDEPDSGGSNIKEDAAVDEHERWRGRLFF